MNNDILLCDDCIHKPICSVKEIYKRSKELINRTNQNMVSDAPDHAFIRYNVSCEMYMQNKFLGLRTRSKEAKDGEFTNKTIN